MLKYIGEGAFIPDLNGELVPARDLTAEEVKHFGREALIASGLYTDPNADTGPLEGPFEFAVTLSQAAPDAAKERE